jgi:hypothetical protein
MARRALPGGWLERGCLALATAAAAVLVAGYATGPGSPAPTDTGQVGGSAVGNARPLVTYDGLMVRRCQAVAVYPAVRGSAATLRSALHAVAKAAGSPLRDLPADVLSAATLEVAVPDVVACLPAGQGAADAERLLAVALPGADHQAAEPVLVHDLAFSVHPRSSNVGVLSDALDREGVLADALGSYELAGSGPTGDLVVGYTGPLLSDGEIELLREAIARPAGTTAAEVGVRPRSVEGVGVELSQEPAAAEVTRTRAPTGHLH